MKDRSVWGGGVTVGCDEFITWGKWIGEKSGVVGGGVIVRCDEFITWGNVERPGSSSDGCEAVLWDGVWGKARAYRREGSGGYTRCSRRYTIKTMNGADGKATCEVGGGPFVLADGEGTAPRGRRRVNRSRGQGGGSDAGGDTPGGRGGDRLRQVEGGFQRVEATLVDKGWGEFGDSVDVSTG